jgi:hypothetical protein
MLKPYPDLLYQKLWEYVQLNALTSPPGDHGACQVQEPLELWMVLAFHLNPPHQSCTHCLAAVNCCPCLRVRQAPEFQWAEARLPA